MSSKLIKEPLATDKSLAKLIDAIKSVGIYPQVIDNLTSESTDEPLSAKQGKVLKGLVDANSDAINAIRTTQTSAIGATPSIETKVSNSSNSVSFSLGGNEAFILFVRGNSLQGEFAIGHTDNGSLTIDARYGGNFTKTYSGGTLTVTNPNDNGIRATLIKSMTVYE